SWAIERFSWQQTMLGYVVILALVAVPGTLLLMRDTAPVQADTTPGTGNKPDKRSHKISSLSTRRALLTAPFWKITLGLMANGFSMTLLGVHGIPMLIDHGFDNTTSALGIGAIGFVAIIGTVLLGRIADAVSRRHMLALIYCVRGTACIALLLVVTGWQLYTVAAVDGLVWAGAMAIVSAILADIYGVRLLGVLYGIAYALQQAAGMASAWLGGWGYETFHSHWLAFGAAAAILFIGSAATLALPKND